MRAVLYSSIDLEPITILHLQQFAVDHLKRNRRVMLPIFETQAIRPHSASLMTKAVNLKTVEIRAETLYIYGKETMMLFTYDDESALLLKSVFLAGQQKELRAIKDDAVIEGVLLTLHKLGFDKGD